MSKAATASHPPLPRAGYVDVEVGSGSYCFGIDRIFASGLKRWLVAESLTTRPLATVH